MKCSRSATPRFQRKCLDKMEDVRQAGRTVIFVSHNMHAVTRLCPRTLLLEDGTIAFDGPSPTAVDLYLGSGTSTNAAREWKDLAKAPGNNIVRLCSVRVRNEEGETCESVDIRKPVGIEMKFEVLEPGHVLVPNYKFVNLEGITIFSASEHDEYWRRRPRPQGHYVSTAWIPGNYLSEGALVIGAAISTMDPVKIHVFERDIVAFYVVDTLDGNSARGDYAGPVPGLVRPLLKWTSEFVPHNSPAPVGEPTS